MVDRPEDFSPRIKICLDGIDLEDDTESRIEDHRFSTGSVSTTSTVVDMVRPNKAASNLPTMTAPPHQVSESNGTRAIDILSWTLETTTAPISNASESDALQASLGFPLPEMTFGNNALVLRHNPSGWEYRFDAEHALKSVKSGELQAGDGGVKVGYADAWLKSRSVQVTLSYTHVLTKSYGKTQS